MVHELTYSIIAVIAVSIISLIGIFSLFLKKQTINKFLMVFIAFAAGSLLATAFFDLIPESFEALKSISLAYVLGGIVLFFLIESVIHWHHNHQGECKDCIHPVAHLNLLGDSLHNFLDGIIIAASFMLSVPTGIATTIAIAAHEIPQELGDFAVLVHSGMSKTRALFFNFISALAAVVGALLAFSFLNKVEPSVPYILAIAAGGFIYIAATDLFPQLHEQKDYRKTIIQAIALLLGILLIWIVLSLF